LYKDEYIGFATNGITASTHPIKEYIFPISNVGTSFDKITLVIKLMVEFHMSTAGPIHRDSAFE